MLISALPAGAFGLAEGVAECVDAEHRSVLKRFRRLYSRAVFNRGIRHDNPGRIPDLEDIAVGVTYGPALYFAEKGTAPACVVLKFPCPETE